MGAIFLFDDGDLKEPTRWPHSREDFMLLTIRTKALRSSLQISLYNSQCALQTNRGIQYRAIDHRHQAHSGISDKEQRQLRDCHGSISS